ncbi:S9 family peptidase [Actinomycetaceae bacterium TAE3-ERU4]|nr:S9 family peptidase [Actinomycetaceae bacterium TAE3-ERU4]
MTNHVLAPKAEKQITTRTHHGHTFTDPWEWLRDKENPAVIEHLQAENAYTAKQLEKTAQLQNQLVTEYREHTVLDENTVPARVRNWWYYSTISEGDNYRKHYRLRADSQDTYQNPPEIDPRNPHQDTEGNKAQLLIDENALAEGKEFLKLANVDISPDDRYLTYGVDNSGDERFTQIILDTLNGQEIDHIDDVVYGVAWSASSNCLYYTRANESWRPYQVWVHRIGQPAETDQLVYEETDETYWMGIASSRDGNWIIIECASGNTSETFLIDAHAHAGSYEGRPTSVAGRHYGLEYTIEPAGDHLLVVHNLNNVDSELAWMPLPTPGVTGNPKHFQTLTSATEGQRYQNVYAYAGHAVVELRSQGNAAALYLLPDPDKKWVIEGEIKLGNNIETIEVQPSEWWWEPQIRFVSQSLKTPPTIADIDPITGQVHTRKIKETPGYKPENYIEERIWVQAEDGAKIPLTIIRHRDTPQDGTAPGIIWGYGSYEVCVDPVWSPIRQSVLDRGVVWALANPRGGGEMGRRWYENGRTLAKKNTFSDFIACSRALIDGKYVAPTKLAANGGSAGGLLMGAIANQAPELYRAILAQVPFVDALTTILKPELPLTAGEWEEWGNPITDPDVYKYMSEYTPYENVRDGQEYPAILATTSLNDTRVYYVEPAKWIQRLREAATNNPETRPLLLHCEMVAGHGGVTGREAKWKECAYETAFLLDQLGKNN